MGKSLIVTGKKSDGTDVTVVVKKPTHSQLTDANFHASSVFNKAKNAKMCLRANLEDYLESEGIWTDKHRKQLNELRDEIIFNLTCLQTGKKDGVKMKLSEARTMAIDTRNLRWRLNILEISKRDYDAYTVEGQAENARFDYLVSICLFDEEGNPLFKDLDDYFEQAEEEYIVQAASKLANLVFGNEDFEKNLPEHQFLIKNGLLDADLRYVDKKGNYINAEGKPVNKDGKLIDSAGNLLTPEVVEEEVTFDDDLSQ